MRYFSLSSLRVRIAILIFLAMVPVLGLAVNTYLQERERAIASVEEEVQRTAQYAAGTQEQLIEGTRQLLVALSRLRPVDEHAAKVCSARFAEMLGEYPTYTNLGAILPDGSLFCSAAASPRPGSFSDQAWFKQTLKAGDFAIGVSQPGTPGSKYSLVFSYPILDDNGNSQGAVFAELGLDLLNQITSQVQLPEKAEFIMTYEDGTIVSYLPEPNNWVGRTLHDAPIIKTILTRGQDVTEGRGLDGVSRLYAFTPLHSTVDTGLYLCIGIPTSIAYSEANKVLWHHLIGLGLVTLLALLAVWFGGDIFILRRVNALVAASKRLSQGDMKARTGLPHGTGELDQLAYAFDEMAEALEAHADKLLNYQEQLRSLASQLSLAEEQERRRIAIELHDRVGQTLAMSKIKLGVLKQSLSDTDLEAAVDEARKLIEEAIQDTRSLIFRISSPILYELGFESAIEWLTEQLRKQHGIQADYEDDGKEKPLDHDIRVILFQATSELLVNVAKHSRANRVKVATHRDDSCIHVSVEDDGVGFDVLKIGSHWRSAAGFGLFSISERLKYLNGHVEIESEPGKRTCVTLVAPLKVNANRAA